METPKNGRLLQLDATKIRQLMDHRGLSVEKVAEKAGSVDSVRNWLKGKPCYRSSAAKLAKALGTTIEALLPTQSDIQVSTVNGYLVTDALTELLSASNGLQFQVLRMRHMELDRLVRGKRFDLSGMPTDEQQRCRTWIKRHPVVCEALRDHANVIRNLDAFFDAGEGFYWVIDEWIDGESLDRLLSSGREFSEAECRSILLDIASGLDALHQQNFIRRELTPANILIASSDRRAVLCEFELAKLIDRGPRGSGSEWPDDPYRAGEADSSDVDLRADIYSWGRIGVHILLGSLPDAGEESQALDESSISTGLKKTLLQATETFRSDRFSSFGKAIDRVRNEAAHG